MCANTNISETVITYIRSQLTAQVPDIDSLLFADGYLDSTAMLDLILWIGDTFKIAVANEDLVPENFATVRNISDFVQRNIPAAERQEGNATPVGYD
ncbi:MAG TPA: acyl carrier protein [Terriglobales bacterium]|nr:acyl carrier protein [Terriglobales bacterium]